VTASSLNVRSSPGTAGAILEKVTIGQRVTIFERGSGWLLVQTPSGARGWVSEQYTATSRPAPAISTPAPLMQTNTAQASGLSCSPRRTCSQIASCSAARWYLANCSWGGRLDRDNDGRPCEAMC
jgi:SH3-like domain-containing protein